MDVSSPSPTAIQRWGDGLLLAALGLGILATFGMAWVAPGWLPLLPVVVLALVGGLVLFQHPRANFVVWLLGFPLLLSSDEGIQLHEALYGLYFYAFLAHWYGRRLLLYQSPLVRGFEDRMVVLWLTLGMALGITLGLLFGTDLGPLRGEVIAFSFVAIYFPIREMCRREERGPLLVLLLIVWIGVYVTIDNALVARQRFEAATELWQIADIRTGGRELLLQFGALLVLAVITTTRSWRSRLFFLLMEGMLVSGLILTKSRVFWVSFAMGIILLVAVAKGERREMLALLGLGSLALFGFALLFAGDYLELIILGIRNRILSLNAAGTDVSLLNRFAESAAVRERIWVNPVLGYGLGTEYTYYRLIEQATLTYNYIHNGYLAVWFKFGIWGMMLVGATWGRATWCAWQVGRARTLPPFERMLGYGVLACLLSMVLPAYTTSVFFEDEKLSAFVIAIALGCGLYQRIPKGSSPDGIQVHPGPYPAREGT